MKDLDEGSGLNLFHPWEDFMNASLTIGGKHAFNILKVLYATF